MEQIKQETIEYLSSCGIDVDNDLPLIETLDEVSPRTAHDVASRLCAIAYIIGLGFGSSGQELEQYLEKYQLLGFASNYEKSLLKLSEIPEQDKINMTWLSESAQALAWSIGLVEIDNFHCCDDDLASKIPFKTSPENFIGIAKLRPIHEIQQQSDLLYRMHWYSKECQLLERECNFSNSIISERRKAIDWVYGVEEDWDEVPMDT